MTLQFELVSPEKVLYSGAVDGVVLPASEGMITVLPQHAPLMTVLQAGVVTVVKGQEQLRLYVRGGFVDVAAEGLTVLAEAALPLADLTAEQLLADLQAAEAALASAKGDEARVEAERLVNNLKDLRSSLMN